MQFPFPLGPAGFGSVLVPEERHLRAGTNTQGCGLLHFKDYMILEQALNPSC